MEANRRNLTQRRGGAAAQRRTRAIHKHLLVILINYLGDLLTGTQELSDSYRRERRVRRLQAEERLEYLEQGNFPENKWEVLLGLRRVLHARSDLDLGNIRKLRVAQLTIQSQCIHLKKSVKKWQRL